MLSVGDSNKVEMTLKPSAVSGGTRGKSVQKIKWSDLQEGMSLDGHVKTVREYGVFVRLAGSKVDGLCHRLVLVVVAAVHTSTRPCRRASKRARR